MKTRREASRHVVDATGKIWDALQRGRWLMVELECYRTAGVLLSLAAQIHRVGIGLASWLRNPTI